MRATTPRLLPARRIAALLALTVQLVLLLAAPLAEAHEPRGGPVHVEAPGEHHAVHNPADCPICAMMQIGAVPGRSTRTPVAAEAPRRAAPPTEPTLHSQPYSFLQVARAPPAV